MTALLTNSDIAQLRSDWNSALFDTCVLQTRVAGYGKPTYTPGLTLACYFASNKTLVGEVGGAQAENIDSHINFARGVTIAPTMRIKVTHLHGDAVSPAQVFEIIGGPILNHVGQKVSVKLVNDGGQT